MGVNLVVSLVLDKVKLNCWNFVNCKVFLVNFKFVCFSWVEFSCNIWGINVCFWIGLRVVFYIFRVINK